MTANREAFKADEDGCCASYGLNGEQREAIRTSNVLQPIDAGGNVSYLAYANLRPDRPDPQRWAVGPLTGGVQVTLGARAVRSAGQTGDARHRNIGSASIRASMSASMRL